jgi:hypothetical protein
MTTSQTETVLPAWQPPAGYIQVESRLDGVSVYAPAPVVETGPETLLFQCPRCGASTAYDPGAASVTCGSCGTQQYFQAQVVGRAAQAAEFTVAVLEREARGWGQERRELHCEACGADLSLAPNDLSATCAFCGSTRVVARAATQDGLRPRFVIPFKVQADACWRLAREWLGRGWMHPAGLAAAAGSAEFKGLYLPFWTFGARVVSNWRAEVGREVQKQVFDTHDAKWKTKTEIEWRWQDGQVMVPVADHIEPATTKVSTTLLARVAAFDLNGLTAYDPAFLAGWQAQAYDRPLATAWENARAYMREAARQACQADVPSPHVRNLSVNADFEDEVWRYILAPVYVAPYRYGDKLYQLMINGQTGAVVGQKPVAWAKVWLVVAALLAPGTLLSLVGLPLLLAAGIGGVLLVLGGSLFLAGLMISAYLVQQAMQAEAA